MKYTITYLGVIKILPQISNNWKWVQIVDYIFNTEIIK